MPRHEFRRLDLRHCLPPREGGRGHGRGGRCTLCGRVRRRHRPGPVAGAVRSAGPGRHRSADLQRRHGLLGAQAVGAGAFPRGSLRRGPEQGGPAGAEHAVPRHRGAAAEGRLLAHAPAPSAADAHPYGPDGRGLLPRRGRLQLLPGPPPPAAVARGPGRPLDLRQAGRSAEALRGGECWRPCCRAPLRPLGRAGPRAGRRAAAGTPLCKAPVRGGGERRRRDGR
mmetsp:Transcript_16946/g.53234  ORF Transcript_16946/g.53234 Transcript_16946/m.53234 type:complete len:225 (+) Transcript_16946:289-963(+)